MKDTFSEYYELPETRIKEIWEDSLIVFDTSVLIDLYRDKENVRNEFIKILEFYKNRLWIPYQVGFEFYNNRENVIHNIFSTYKSLSEDLSEQIQKIIEKLNRNRDYFRHPYIDIKDVEAKLNKCVTAIVESLDKQSNSHPDSSQKDIILDAISEIFQGRVGDDFSDKELDALYKEGEKRYAIQKPPGYCDEKNKKDKSKRNLYGDLIVWKQLINHSSKVKKDIILITNDHKKDWWDKVDGKHSPRKELIKEFTTETKQNIIIYDRTRFLMYAKNHKYIKINKTIMDKILKAQEEDLIFFKRIKEAQKGFEEYNERLNKARESFIEWKNKMGIIPKISASDIAPITNMPSFTFSESNPEVVEAFRKIQEQLYFSIEDMIKQEHPKLKK